LAGSHRFLQGFLGLEIGLTIHGFTPSWRLSLAPRQRTLLPVM
jgi:hypothetical protein